MNKTRLLSRALILCTAGTLGACSGDKPVNIGNTNVIGSELSDYAATWKGFAEALVFWPDGSDQVQLTIDASGQGTLEFGDAALLAPPTDPNVGYPPGGFTSSGGSLVTHPNTALTVAQGFLYPTYGAVVSSDRIQVGVDPSDLYAGWCPLQTPYPVDGAPGHDACLYEPANTTISSGLATGQCTITLPGGTAQPVDCLKLDLCGLAGTACTCTDTGCVANTVPTGSAVGQYPIQIDGALDSTGTTLTATLVLPEGRFTIVLQKQ